MLSLVGESGAHELYHGTLCATDANGLPIFDEVDYRDYTQYIHEQVKPWSYMKFPFLTALGKIQGWYRVGPLARVNNCDFFTTPLAEAKRREFFTMANDAPVHPPLAYHWARMIELLHAAEAIKDLLHDDELSGSDLVLEGKLQQEGIGVIEAPRGTLFHHYRINENGLVEKANLIVSTTNNNQAINESIRHVAAHHLDGKTLDEPLLNHIEVAIRAYDPCLSCATHAMGKMPLLIEIVDHNGNLVHKIEKNSRGDISSEI
jgi:NAD-reducing hydrogenase large subunit